MGNRETNMRFGSNDTNRLKENQISSNSRTKIIEDKNILHNFNNINSNLDISAESVKPETQSKHMN